MARPLFKLNPRLALCARLIRPGVALCDVGADHAYLSIWLLKSGAVPSALATDLRAGPLETARENAQRYHVGEKLSLLQTDGLTGVDPAGLENIVIAGMGGETILHIIGDAPWLKEKRCRLVIQPMSSAEILRRELAAAGFEILEEHAVLDAGRPYTAFAAEYTGQPPATGPLYPYIGKLQPQGEAAKLYAQKVLRDLRGRLQGAKLGRGEQSPEELEKAITGIEQDFLSKITP